MWGGGHIYIYMYIYIYVFEEKSTRLHVQYEPWLIEMSGLCFGVKARGVLCLWFIGGPLQVLSARITLLMYWLSCVWVPRGSKVVSFWLCPIFFLGVITYSPKRNYFRASG